MSLQYFDDLHGSWITLLRNSPPIKVVHGSKIHMKLRDVDVDIRELVTDHRQIVIKSDSMEEAESPSKRKVISQDAHEIVDLTLESAIFDTPSSKRTRLLKLEDDSSPLGLRSTRRGVVSVGDVPVIISQFPARKATDMDARMLWIAENSDIGAIEKRFSMVFSCKYTGTTYHRHQRIWKQLRKSGLLPTTCKESTWRDVSSLLPDGKSEKVDKVGSETPPLSRPPSRTSVEL